MSGYPTRELEDIQRTWKLRFPPDLLKLYQTRRSVIAGGFDWIKSPARQLREMIEWPVEGLVDQVRSGEWYPEWGERPRKDADAAKLFLEIVGKAPRMIPIYQHRCIPETPHESGNPVFSIYGFDTIHYGANLKDYVAREGTGARHAGPMPKPKVIPFWSRLVELNVFSQ